MEAGDGYYHSIKGAVAVPGYTQDRSENHVQGNGMIHFIAGAKELRSAIGSDIPLQQVMILVHLWLHGKCRQTDLCKELGMLRAAVSRNCRSMSSYYVPGEEGYVTKGQQLLVTERDTYLRHDYYWLSKRGQEIMDRFAAELSGLST